MTPPSAVAPNLALDDHLARNGLARDDVVNLGLGEAGLPVHPALLSRLAAAASANEYGPVAGTEEEVRGAVADLEPVRPALEARGITGAAELQSHLLDEHGIAVLGGHHFGDDAKCLRFRAATSRLYGSSPEEQWAALRDPRPERLPHVTGQIQRLQAALVALAGDAARAG